MINCLPEFPGTRRLRLALEEIDRHEKQIPSQKVLTGDLGKEFHGKTFEIIRPRGKIFRDLTPIMTPPAETLEALAEEGIRRAREVAPRFIASLRSHEGSSLNVR